MITEVNEITQADHEAGKHRGLREATSGALVSAGGQKEVVQGAQGAEKYGGESGVGDSAACCVKLNTVKSGHWISQFQGHHWCMSESGELSGGYCRHCWCGLRMGGEKINVIFFSQRGMGIRK